MSRPDWVPDWIDRADDYDVEDEPDFDADELGIDPEEEDDEGCEPGDE